jgi:hypothetical protein
MKLSDEKASEAIAELMKMRLPFGHGWSAFTDKGIGTWRRYMEKEMPEEWNQYLWYVAEGNVIGFDVMDKEGITDSEILNAQLNPHHLVKYLFDNLDRWGYEELCPHYYFEDNICKHPFKTTCQTYTRCGGTGKVLSEKARKFKAIVEGEGE